MRITGYTDRWVFGPGDTVPLHVSSAYPRYQARLLRHRGPITKLDDWETAIEWVDDAALAAIPGKLRAIRTGSSAIVQFANPFPFRSFELSVMPTLSNVAMTIARLTGASETIELRYEVDQLIVAAGAEAIALPMPIGRWTVVTLTQQSAGCLLVRTATAFDATHAAADLVLAADWLLHDLSLAPRFEGRLAAPTLRGSRGEVVAAWAFDDRRDGQLIPNRVAGPAMMLVNAPSLLHRSADDTLSAAAFHLDDLSDASWPVDAAMHLPDDLPSGVYGIVLSAADSVDWLDRAGFDILPVFVRPNRPAARIALVLPTFSYRAYANSSFFDEADPEIFRRKAVSWSKPLHDHAIAQGLRSLYDCHNDGSGVSLASLRRPQLTVRADYISLLQGFAHQFAADLAIVGWLETAQAPYDVLTDECLHEGADLSGYDVVITGSHPEYTSPELLDAYRQYANNGGSLLYLGGNGFYWSVGIDPADASVMEVRRRDGVRTWTVHAGETRHQTDGREGGLWRNLGHAPNRLFGIGFSAHGYSGDGGYRVAAGLDLARLPRRLADTLLGFAGRSFGIAGLELDRHNFALGEPGPVTVLASTSDMPAGYVPAIEEFGALDAFLPDANAALAHAVRGDIVLARLPGGGQVFSIGSIRWSSGLADPDDRAGVRALTQAALDDLLEDAATRRAENHAARA